MGTTKRSRKVNQLCLALVMGAACFTGGELRGIAYAQEMLSPRPAMHLPLFSFDAQSASVERDGTFQADDILNMYSSSGVQIPGSAVRDAGLSSSDVDGISMNQASLLTSPAATFAITFSVDRGSIGAVGPNEELVSGDTPFNVKHQAALYQAAGDLFVSTDTFSASGCVRGASMNNVLVQNNFDEGGRDFGAQPPKSAHESNPTRVQDDVDAVAFFMAVMQEQVTGRPEAPPYLYYSLRASGLGTPLVVSGADVRLMNFATKRKLGHYATAAQCGLQSQDEMDDFVVFDRNNDGRFNDQDFIVFSLAPGSPTLTQTGYGPADVLRVDLLSGTPTLSRLATARQLGLAPTDNIDALDVFPGDAWEIARHFGVKRHPWKEE